MNNYPKSADTPSLRTWEVCELLSVAKRLAERNGDETTAQAVWVAYQVAHDAYYKARQQEDK